MHLLYVDDSGSVQDPQQEYFVLAGFSVFERQGHWMSEELEKIAARFNQADPQSVELHGSPMMNGSKAWRGFKLPERVQAMKDALQVLANSHRSNRVFGVAVRKSSVSPRDPVELAFEELSRRFDHYLMRLHKANDTQRGLFIFDKTTRETSIQTLATDYKRFGHAWGQTRNMAEVPVFIDSRASRLVQLADLIAYGIFRHYERKDSQLFDVFKDRFDAAGGTVYGLCHVD